MERLNWNGNAVMEYRVRQSFRLGSCNLQLF